jgi:hypothetical protein
MSKTVRLPEDLHEELKARKGPDETMAEVIARHLNRPHPAETRAFLQGDEAAAVEEAIDGLYADTDQESDRLARARRAFEESTNESGDEA